ncbi:MAG: energy-coupling factor transporter transmembrane protein EcfT [Desulfurococcales archaeon]|nr:energy-coupling factor transporter transmembrane protein EcfT [Desulfurococcales archaeon]
MIYGLLQRVLRLLAYREEDSILYRAHILFKLAALGIAWATLLHADTPQGIAAGLLYPILLHTLSPRWLAKHAMVAAMIPTLFIGVAGALLSPYPPLSPDWGSRLVVLTARTYGLASATLITFATTSPSRLASLLARSPFAHDLTTLFYRLAPLTLGDLAEAMAAQRMLGKPVHHTLIPLVISSLRRAEGVTVSLQARGYRSDRRTSITGPGDPVWGLALLVASLASLGISLLAG